MNLPMSYMIVEFGIIFFLLVGFALLLALTVVRKDVAIIKEHPFLFAIETVLVSMLPAIPLFFFVISRDMPMRTALNWFYGLSIKFAIFHVLFQISGFYSYLFGTV